MIDALNIKNRGVFSASVRLENKVETLPESIRINQLQSLKKSYEAFLFGEVKPPVTSNEFFNKNGYFQFVTTRNL